MTDKTHTKDGGGDRIYAEDENCSICAEHFPNGTKNELHWIRGSGGGYVPICGNCTEKLLKPFCIICGERTDEDRWCEAAFVPTEENGRWERPFCNECYVDIGEHYNE